MRARLGTLAIVAAAVAASTSVVAQPCQTGLTPLCDVADEAEVDRLFGDYADYGLIALASVVLLVVVMLLIWLLRKPVASPKLDVEVHDAARQIEPGGTAELGFEVENRRERTSADVAVLVDDLPEGWTARASAAVVYASGFSTPQDLSDGRRTFHLTSARRNAHRASVTLSVTAPPDVSPDGDVVEVRARVVPVAGGAYRMGRARKVKFSLVPTAHAGGLQIASVVHTPESLTAGTPVVTRALITNASEAEARDVGVNFLLNDTPVERQVVAQLAPRAEAQVEFHWTATTGENRIRITIG